MAGVLLGTAFDCDPSDSPLSRLEELPSPEPLPDQEAGWREVGVFVGSLPAHQRLLVVLTFWLGLTERQIAHAIGVNQRTVNRRKAVTLEGLRSHYKGTRAATTQRPVKTVTNLAF